MLTKGVVREGLISFNGIMNGQGNERPRGNCVTQNKQVARVAETRVFLEAVRSIRVAEGWRDGEDHLLREKQGGQGSRTLLRPIIICRGSFVRYT